MGAVPMPPPTSTAVEPRGGGANGSPSGPSSISASPAFSSRQPARARAHVLQQELQLGAAPGTGPDAREREGPRQVGPLAGSPSPPVARGEHVELARARVAGSGEVAGGDEVVGAEPAHVAHLGHAPLGRAEACAVAAHSVLHARTGVLRSRAAPAAAPPRARPSAAPRIARWAALAPLIVVMHGMPRATAAAADLPAVAAGAGAGRRVDHQVDVAGVDALRPRWASPRRS